LPVIVEVKITNNCSIPYLLTIETAPDFAVSHSEGSTNRPIYAYENVFVPGETRVIEMTVTRKSSVMIFWIRPIVWVQPSIFVSNEEVQGTPM